MPVSVLINTRNKKSMAPASNQAWHKIAETAADIKFSRYGLAEIDIAGKFFCIAKHNNKLFACTQKCPHAGGILADGYVDALGNIVCPLHQFKFSPASGRNLSGEGYFLKTFPVEERKEGVFIFLKGL